MGNRGADPPPQTPGGGDFRFWIGDWEARLAFRESKIENLKSKISSAPNPQPPTPNKPAFFSTPLVYLLLPAWLLVSPPALAQDGRLQAGAAKLELPLPAHVPLAGYSRRRGKPSSGVHDPAYVRAVVLGDGERRIALVSCDLLIIDEPLFDAVQERLRHGSRSPVPQLLLAATHTHSGPGAYGRKFFEKISMGHFDPAVFEGLVSAMTRSIEEAAGRLAPVRLEYGSASAAELIVNRMEAAGPVDAEAAAVSLWGDAGELRAAIVNFAAHPTTLGVWNRQVSADYPGVLTAAIEAEHPGAVCLFFAGAVGDQAPVKRGEAFERPALVGKELAALARALLAGHERPLAQPQRLQVRQAVMPLDQARVRLGRLALPGWFSRALVDDDATLTLVAAGPVLFIGAPCDLSAELGLALKAKARALGYDGVIVGFANDYIGYCLPARLYNSDQYEAMMSFNGPRTGEQIVETLDRMMHEMATGDK
ncbi:MAG: neutral/alkaline non-lysosomal ceramidase N-terminal domain-containing protein [Candidatus Omnitrophica bacterium]|nr:neutral/alkaline non-lysosomal ceramidase N-terminal domain-containing protein [Candidatus Omnitrophota bacterium]